MKRLIGITVVILAVSVAICLGAMLSLNGLLNRAHGMAVDIRVYAENGDEPATREGLVALAAYWDRWRRLFEVITDHDDLRDVKERIIQAQLNFATGECEQFLSDIALVGEGIDHIREEESLHWSNLLRAVPADARCRVWSRAGGARRHLLPRLVTAILNREAIQNLA